MPELPEVEVVRRGLEEHLVGRRFTDVEVCHPRAVRSGDPDALVSFFCDATVSAVKRRGKFLWLDFGQDLLLQVHLGMSGQMLVADPGQVQSPHVRIRAGLSDGRELCFVDQRTFGEWRLEKAVPDPWGVGAEGASKKFLPHNVRHIAADPLEPAFDAREAVERMKAKRSAVKTVLLNQEVVSGIGNIYADEALFLAGVRPRRSAALLSRPTLHRIVDAATEVMERALEQGGTSFDSLYVNVNGASGYFSRSLKVYGRDGEPCKRCGSLIKRIVIGGRSTHYCAQCQR
ncbi:bifunctional DNA-formamidopyrimidine glycosylase/DNA-(apurinic or apyrimidinic site) lyase [Corynebacterium macclintockiae]|uniref:bifunctional DNA-formamidopyrimidine glycosylase/DNA-(apurinic or apyrimidinic site) lyase n=1 Tax=Corynebacterium macclintockiae TaxID=2913501 RepID=UPI003EC0AAF1